MTLNKLEPLDSVKLNSAVQLHVASVESDILIYNSLKTPTNPVRIRYVYKLPTTSIDIDQVAKVLVNGFLNLIKSRSPSNCASVVLHPPVESKIAPETLRVKLDGCVIAYFTSYQLENSSGINAWIVSNVVYK